jgi:hypothetical protein
MTIHILGKKRRSGQKVDLVTFGVSRLVYVNKFGMQAHFKNIVDVLLELDDKTRTFWIKPLTAPTDKSFRLSFSSQQRKATGVIACRSAVSELEKILKIDLKGKARPATWNPKEKRLEVQF